MLREKLTALECAVAEQAEDKHGIETIDHIRQRKPATAYLLERYRNERAQVKAPPTQPRPERRPVIETGRGRFAA
jgi:hypothetical protein